MQWLGGRTDFKIHHVKYSHAVVYDQKSTLDGSGVVWPKIRMGFRGWLCKKQSHY